MPASRWEKIVWPRWLPATARMPLIAQVTGAVALTALLVGPWWSRVAPTVPPAPTAASAPAIVKASAPKVPDVPAHLNLDIRHTFGSLDLSVTVDGKHALDTKLGGSGKKFGVFGKRSERGFTRTLDLDPGVRVVRVHLRSAADRFDQTRIERFELAAASVAALRIVADKSGLSVSAVHPPIAPVAPVASPAQTATPTVLAEIRADAVGELLQSMRAMLIAIAGFVASAATGFLVQDYLRSRRSLFTRDAASDTALAQPNRRRRRRSPGAASAP